MKEIKKSESACIYERVSDNVIIYDIVRLRRYTPSNEFKRTSWTTKSLDRAYEIFEEINNESDIINNDVKPFSETIEEIGIRSIQKHDVSNVALAGSRISAAKKEDNRKFITELPTEPAPEIIISDDLPFYEEEKPMEENLEKVHLGMEVQKPEPINPKHIIGVDPVKEEPTISLVEDTYIIVPSKIYQTKEGRIQKSEERMIDGKLFYVAPKDNVK